MIEALITSKTRIKLLVKFFLNTDTKSYLRQLANEFGESTNAVRVELNRLSETGVLESYKEKNTIIYKASESHPLFNEIKSIVSKYTGMDALIERITNKLGNVSRVYLVGDYAQGNDKGLVEIVLLGSIEKDYLNHNIPLLAKEIKRSIVFQTYEHEGDFLNEYKGHRLLLWESGN